MVSLIVPTCNRTGDLQRCLEALIPQVQSSPHPVELIVMDDSKTDETRELLARNFPQASWNRGPQRGPAANRNSGAARSGGDWLIFVDDDCIPSSGFLAAYLKRFPTASAFEGAIYKTPFPTSLLFEAPHQTEGTGRLSCSCHFAIKRAVFEEIGGFDERYLAGVYAEDTDFSARLSASSVEVIFIEEASVVHPARSLPSSLQLARRWEGKAIFAFDQGASAFTILWRLPWHVLRVIQSRFRRQPFNRENRAALWKFSGEWLCALLLTPLWVWKWSRRERSSFWKSEVTKTGAVSKFGF